MSAREAVAAALLERRAEIMGRELSWAQADRLDRACCLDDAAIALAVAAEFLRERAAWERAGGHDAGAALLESCASELEGKA